MQLIDSHLHIWSQDDIRYPPGADGTGGQTWDASIETLISYMDRQRVERVVAINPRRYLQDQRYLLDAAARFPDRVTPVARVHGDDPDVLTLLHELATTHNVRGIRLVWFRKPSNAWPADPVVEPVWKACSDLGITIGFLASPDNLPAIGHAARRHPQVHVVIDHWGGLKDTEGPSFARFDAVAELANLSNVYLKATCFRRLSLAGFPFTDVHPLLRRALDAFGRERVMWGTDFGGGVTGEQYGDEVAAITSHINWLTPSDKEWLLRLSAFQAWHITKS